MGAFFARPPWSSMQHMFSISEIVARIGEGRDEVHVWATANAEYDSGSQIVTVRIDRGARNAITGATEPAPDWLPEGETVAEHLAREEVQDFTRDVFERWVSKAHSATPLDLNLVLTTAG